MLSGVCMSTVWTFGSREAHRYQRESISSGVFQRTSILRLKVAEPGFRSYPVGVAKGRRTLDSDKSFSMGLVASFRSRDYALKSTTAIHSRGASRFAVTMMDFILTRPVG